MRRRADPRQHHEADSEPEGFHGADAVVWHQPQHEPDRLCSDQANPDGSLRWRELETVRSRNHRRGPRLTATPVSAAPAVMWEALRRVAFVGAGICLLWL